MIQMFSHWSLLINVGSLSLPITLNNFITFNKVARVLVIFDGIYVSELTFIYLRMITKRQIVIFLSFPVRVLAKDI